jgi:prepilin-type N-terminal cleavage/methylation domain-containing protein
MIRPRLKSHADPQSTARAGRGGFTLIELLVVVAIIALLISILVPTLSLAREQGKTVKCGANLEQIGVALSICQNEYNNFFPMWDDGAINPNQKKILGTWLDVLKQRYAYGMDGGYCPSDNRPDFLNAQRGGAWDFRYPPPGTMQGRIGGADYSYAISIPLASGAHMSDDTYTCGGVTESTKDLFHRGVSNRVLAGDAFWSWLHNLSGQAIISNDFSTPNWFSNTAGYRHGLSITFRPGANFLKQDLHVEEAKFDLSRYENGIDTSLHFITCPGEPLDVYPALGANQGSPPAKGFPKELDPVDISTNSQWLPEIRIRKGFDSPAS